MTDKPRIEKLGTLACGLVEATPVVFRDRLYRFEYVRGPEYYAYNTTGDTYFRFIDVAANQPTPGFAQGYHLGCAYVDGDTVYVYGVPKWGAAEVEVFWSHDLKYWSSQRALSLPSWGIYNTSVCRAEERWVMAFEVNEPKEIVGVGFTIFFAESADGLNWQPLPPIHVYDRTKYTACPALRYLDSYFYMIYLECLPRKDQDDAYAPYIVRSPDLIHWESSPYNPIMQFSDEDRRIANPSLNAEERQRIATAYNRNNSDVDLCEFNNDVIIYYSWGNQLGIEHLAEAVYRGTLQSFLRGFFPTQQDSAVPEQPHRFLAF